MWVDCGQVLRGIAKPPRWAHAPASGTARLAARPAVHSVRPLAQARTDVRAGPGADVPRGAHGRRRPRGLARAAGRRGATGPVPRTPAGRPVRHVLRRYHRGPPVGAPVAAGASAGGLPAHRRLVPRPGRQPARRDRAADQRLRRSSDRDRRPADHRPAHAVLSPRNAAQRAGSGGGRGRDDRAAGGPVRRAAAALHHRRGPARTRFAVPGSRQAEGRPRAGADAPGRRVAAGDPAAAVTRGGRLPRAGTQRPPL